MNTKIENPADTKLELETDLEQDSFSCELCSIKFDFEIQLQKHNSEEHDKKSTSDCLVCDECGDAFAKLRKLLYHKQYEHKSKLKCEDCDAVFTRVNSLCLHQRIHKGIRPHKCNECGATFVQSSHLSIHKRSHTGEKPYQCDVCKQKFKQISHLRTHQRIHTQAKPYSCSECSSVFGQKSSLNRHMRMHTGERPYRCTICPATFCTNSNLNRHLLMHTGVQPFKCEVCSATFRQAVDLNRHKIGHSGIKPYQCDLCESSFSRKNNLRLHKFMHSGESPYKCDMCDATFSRPRDLRRHLSNHYGCFTCKICDEKFPMVSTYKKHMHVHKSDRCFTCEVCCSKFATNAALKRHHQLKHSNNSLDYCDFKPLQIIDETITSSTSNRMTPESSDTKPLCQNQSTQNTDVAAKNVQIVSSFPTHIPLSQQVSIATSSSPVTHNDNSSLCLPNIQLLSSSYSNNLQHNPSITSSSSLTYNTTSTTQLSTILMQSQPTTSQPGRCVRPLQIVQNTTPSSQLVTFLNNQWCSVVLCDSTTDNNMSSTQQPILVQMPESSVLGPPPLTSQFIHLTSATQANSQTHQNDFNEFNDLLMLNPVAAEADSESVSDVNARNNQELTHNFNQINS